MTEIFAHGVTVLKDPEAEGVYQVRRFGWDNEPFIIYLNEEAASDLLWQLGTAITGIMI